MLKMLLSPALALLSTCNLNTSVVRYCGANTDREFAIHFSDEEIVYTSAGVSDQRFPIMPCSDDIRLCFLGEISFVHPYQSTVSLNENVVSAEQVGDSGYIIITRGAGTQASYHIERGDAFPKEFRISDLDEQEQDIFARC